MVCQFLLYNKVNQLYVYIYPHIPSLLCLPPTLPFPPLQVETKHRADLPVLCYCFPLAICFTFGRVYMYLPVSHFIAAYPSPSPCPQSVLYVCVFICVLLLGSSEPFCFFLDSICMCQHMVFVFLFLTYFTLYDRLQVHPPHYKQLNFSLWLSNIPLYICAASLSIHLSMDTQVASMSWLL